MHGKGGAGSHPMAFSHLANIVQEEIEYEWEDGIHGRSIWEGGRLFLCGEYGLGSFLAFLFGKVFYKFAGYGLNLGARRLIRAILRKREFDVILSSSGGARMYELADYAARISGLPVVHDFRDIIEELGAESRRDERSARRLLARRNAAIGRSAGIIGVIQDHVNIIKENSSNARLIYNGYDPDVFGYCEPEHTDTFDMVYIGSIYWIENSVEMLFDGIKCFVEKYGYCDGFNVVFYSTADAFQAGVVPFLPPLVAPVVSRKDPVPQTELKRVFAKTSVLLVMGNKTVGIPVGISTKVFEYLASGRPILEAISGDERDCEVVLRGANAGYIARTPEAISDYLWKSYCEWKMNGLVRGTTNMEYVKQFSRKTQAEQFEKILEDVIEERAKNAV